MKSINEIIDSKINESQSELTAKDWQLLAVIVDYLRGDLKRQLQAIREKEDLKTLYKKVNNEYKKAIK